MHCLWCLCVECVLLCTLFSCDCVVLREMNSECVLCGQCAVCCVCICYMLELYCVTMQSVNVLHPPSLVPQPAEETSMGARAMVMAGAMDGVAVRSWAAVYYTALRWNSFIWYCTLVYFTDLHCTIALFCTASTRNLLPSPFALPLALRRPGCLRATHRRTVPSRTYRCGGGLCQRKLG
jgi:hypothetical protein